MIYINSKSDSPYINFGYEYYFATEKKFDDSIFMLWKTKPTLMVGKYQNTLEEINLAYAKENGIMLVRRYSGGGTIYTDLGGRQYTVISKDSGGISFAENCAPVINALHSLNINAELTGRNDILVDGRKISGTAQYKTPDMTVHHGSLLFDSDIETMVKATSVDEYKITSKSIKSVRDRVTNIREHLKNDMTADKFESYLVSYITKSADVYEPTDDDISRIKEIAFEKFEDEKNIFGSNPKCDIKNTARFKGGKITASISVKGGRITGLSLCGDFFLSCGVCDIENVLKGVMYNKSDIQKALDDNFKESPFFGITLGELSALICGD